MKRILMALMLCLVSVTAFSQSWDYLDEITRYSVISRVNSFYVDTVIYHDTTYNEYRTFTYHAVVEKYDNNAYVQTKIHRPTQSVLANYHIGTNCFTTGKTIVGISIPVMFVGVMCLAGGMYDDNYNARCAGYAIMGVGCTLISVSIPLMCFGDHIKRECNMIIGK